MKNTFKFIGIALVVLGFASPALAQIGVSDGAYAEAHIITPLWIEKSVDMDFGNVGVIDQLGTIVLGTDGSRTGGGGATPATPSGTVTAAEFDMSGEAGQQIFITIQGVAPALATVDVVHTNTVDFMTVSNFVTSPVSGFTLLGATETILVGATLNTGVSQEPGDYHTEDDWVLTINYQ